MRMRLGEVVSTTLFGTSHGPSVGAIVEGLPAGLEVDEERMAAALALRRTGGPLTSTRKETDDLILRSGVHNGRTTGQPLVLEIMNNDARSSDYSFLPNRPRPAHQDLPMQERTEGHADLRGGGSSSARLTAPLVAAAAIMRPLLDDLGVRLTAHVGAIGSIEATLPMHGTAFADGDLRCQDGDVVEAMRALIEATRSDRNSIGSRVDLVVSGLPMGLGEPWFDGVEPALARALMAVPGARAIEVGQGVRALRMLGSEHHGAWRQGPNGPQLQSEVGEGALGGLASGADLVLRVTLKPPSSIPRPQPTIDLQTSEEVDVTVKGRHDPVLAPRGVAVVEAMAVLVLTDLAARGGHLHG